jgi:hypothetical protein
VSARGIELIGVMALILGVVAIAGSASNDIPGYWGFAVGGALIGFAVRMLVQAARR